MVPFFVGFKVVREVWVAMSGLIAICTVVGAIFRTGLVKISSLVVSDFVPLCGRVSGCLAEWLCILRRARHAQAYRPACGATV